MIHEKGHVLIEAFANLVMACDQLSEAIQSGNEKIWTPDPEESCHEAVLKVSNHVKNIWYDDDQKGPETKRMIGVVVVSSGMADIVKRVNDDKRAFFNAINDVMADVPQRRVAALRNLLDGWKGKREKEVSMALDRLGANRINLLQAYREFVVLDEPVRSVSFTWNARSSSTVRISAQGVVDLIDAKISNPDKASMYIDRISRSRESEFAVSRGLKPNLKANIVFENKERCCVVAHSPLFLHTVDGNLPKKIRWKSLDEIQGNKTRKNSASISQEALIPELHIYTYR